EYGFAVFFFDVCSITGNSPRVLPSGKPGAVHLEDPDAELVWSDDSVWKIDPGVLSLHDDEGFEIDPADYGDEFAQFDDLIDEEKIEELVEFERARYTTGSKLGM
ncbi:hypothetical protein, partial [Gemmobacter nectariphilus]|uniref:hypothetical protein n=1 Tax=Gemmobacter nectariphilus TaxID=220343 RepID=UPI000484E869